YVARFERRRVRRKSFADGVLDGQHASILSGARLHFPTGPRASDVPPRLSNLVEEFLSGHRSTSGTEGSGPLRRGIQQLGDGSAQSLHLCHAADRDIRVADKEHVAFKSGAEDLLNRFAVLGTPEAVPHPVKDLVEPGTRLPQDVLDVWLEVAIVDDGKEDAGIVIEERYPEVVHRADTRFPVGSLCLDLRTAFAEQFRPARSNLADAGNLPLFPYALARPVRLTGRVLRHCCTLVLDHFHFRVYLRVHCVLLTTGLLLHWVAVRRSHDQ